MANTHMKRFPTSYVIRKMQILKKMRYNNTCIKRAKIWNADNTKCRQRYGATGAPLLVEMQNGTAISENSLAFIV